jgi:outer membrane lipoprotein carrier protein LolA
MRRCLATLALGAVLATAAAATPLDIRQLFAQIARERPTRAVFHERKYLALLDKPLESSGELVFTPPSRLEKRTLSPKPELVVVEGDTVTLERGGKRHTLELAGNPAVAVLVESVRATLAGDLASLTRTYSAALAGDAQKWHLVLRPLDPSLGTLVERVEISGSQARVQSVEIIQPDGDRAVMTITPQ